MNIKVSDYIAEFLRAQHIEYVFEVAGGMITHLLDSIHQQQSANIISMHHEQAAAFAADAYGRITGKPGVAFATSGPGATNLLTGIASCYFDSSPALFITGQVNTFEQKGTRNIRQLGFQETDIVEMAKPVTKQSVQVNVANDIEAVFHEAYQSAISQRPGPVLIDLPMNIQREQIAVIDNASLEDIETAEKIGLAKNLSPAESLTPAENLRPATYSRDPAILLDQKSCYATLNHKAQPCQVLPVISQIKRQSSASPTNLLDISLLQEEINKAARPILLIGGGVRAAQAKEEILVFIKLTQIPAVTSLMALDILPFEHPQRVGFIGTYGNRWANLALSQADLLIVVGSRLDVRQTGADVAGFACNKTILHVDCEAGEINNRVTGCMSIVADAKVFLTQANEQLAAHIFPCFQEWQNAIQLLKKTWPDVNELGAFSGINPNHFMHALSRVSSLAKGYVADVGNHQMWAAQSLEINAHQVFLTSGGMGAMGFALPAAIGASLAFGKKPMVVIVGDGAFQMNIQELQTVVRNRIPLKIIVLNNKCLGMIRQFQDSYFEGRYQSTYWGYSAPDFTAVAKAYGIASRTMTLEEEMDDMLHWLWETEDEPSLLQVMINPHMNVYPKIAFGRPISDMEPFVKPLGMEST